MFNRKEHIIVGLATFHLEFLRISIPAIGKLKQKIYLIVHNSNPAETIRRAQIRKLGFHGPIHIINARLNAGRMQSRLDTLSAAEKLRIKSQWCIFVDDGDILLDLDIPKVQSNNFAVIQNMAFIRRRLLDLLRAMDNPKNCSIDILERPHLGINGTLMRTGLMLKLGKMIESLKPQIHETDASLGLLAPEDMLMWTYLQMYARHEDPHATAIYMDHTNYIATNFDSEPQKYQDNIMQRYCDLFSEIL